MSRLRRVAAYSQYLSAAVTVQYRLGDILLSASGVFVGDSGRSIFLEQHHEQRGRRNYFRWEIPYANIHSIEANSRTEEEAQTEDRAELKLGQAKAVAAGAGNARAASGTISPLSRPPKTA